MPFRQQVLLFCISLVSVSTRWQYEIICAHWPGLHHNIVFVRNVGDCSPVFVLFVLWSPAVADFILFEDHIPKTLIHVIYLLYYIIFLNKYLHETQPAPVNQLLQFFLRRSLFDIFLRNTFVYQLIKNFLILNFVILAFLVLIPYQHEAHSGGVAVVPFCLRTNFWRCFNPLWCKYTPEFMGACRFPTSNNHLLYLISKILFLALYATCNNSSLRWNLLPFRVGSTSCIHEFDQQYQRSSLEHISASKVQQKWFLRTQYEGVHDDNTSDGWCVKQRFPADWGAVYLEVVVWLC